MTRLLAALTFSAFAAAMPAPWAGAGTVTGTASIDGAPAAGAIVYLEGEAGAVAARPTPGPLVMDQRNLQFLPKVLPVVRGTVVRFTNSDDVPHNVFTPSDTAEHFDLGTYNRGESRSVRFDNVGDAVILCNIHMEMEAHVLVLAGPLFAVAGADGQYRIEGVPPGAYTARLWHREWLPAGRAVEVPDSETWSLDLDFAESR